MYDVTTLFDAAVAINVRCQTIAKCKRPFTKRPAPTCIRSQKRDLLQNHAFYVHMCGRGNGTHTFSVASAYLECSSSASEHTHIVVDSRLGMRAVLQQKVDEKFGVWAAEFRETRNATITSGVNFFYSLSFSISDAKCLFRVDFG